MKHSKFFALTLSLALLLVTALPMTASALDTSGMTLGTITIQPPASLSLAVGDFYGYKLFDLININLEGGEDVTTDAITPKIPYTPFDPNTNNSLGAQTSAHFVYKPAVWLEDFLEWADEEFPGRYETDPELFRKELQKVGQQQDKPETTGLTIANPVLQLAKDLAIYEKVAGKAALLASSKLADPTKSSSNGSLVFSNVKLGYYLVLGTGRRVDNNDPVVSRGMLINVPEEVFGTGTNAGKVVKLDKHARRVLKADAPDLKKEVRDDEKNDKYNPALEDPWGERAEHDIGELYSYRITVTIPSDYSLRGYDLSKYIFKIYDEMSAGITLEKANGTAITASDITVTRSPGTPSGYTLEAGTHFSLEADTDPDSFVVTILPFAFTSGVVKEGDILVLEYKARLNENAVINGPNINTAYLEYSNNPNWDGSGTQPTGKTPEDETEVFTFSFHVKKVDGEDNVTPLEGATFQLFSNKRTGTTDEKDAAISFVKVNGNTYRIPAATETEDLEVNITTVANGELSFLGLDEGIYWLVETKAPIGYNLLQAPIKIMISSTGAVSFIDNDEDLADPTKEVAVSSGNKILIQNHTGGTLPGTGGIGIYVILAAGGLMAILLTAAYVVYRRKKTLGLS